MIDAGSNNSHYLLSLYVLPIGHWVTILSDSSWSLYLDSLHRNLRYSCWSKIPLLIVIWTLIIFKFQRSSKDSIRNHFQASDWGSLCIEGPHRQCKRIGGIAEKDSMFLVVSMPRNMLSTLQLTRRGGRTRFAVCEWIGKFVICWTQQLVANTSQRTQYCWYTSQFANHWGISEP